MVKERQDRPPSWDEVYLNTMALYALIKSSPGTIRVKRADMKQGEVAAEPVDFICDVELKAKQALMCDTGQIVPHWYAEWQKVLDDPDSYELLSTDLRTLIGFTFGIKLLGVDGDYRRLYWRYKQDQDRRSILTEESEDDNAGDDFFANHGDTGFDFGYNVDGTTDPDSEAYS